MPGMVMSVIELIARNDNPGQDEICSWLDGNLCRCTGYRNIIAAVSAAARAVRGEDGS